MNVDLENTTRDELKQLALQLLTRLEILEQRNKELEAENERLRKETNKKNPPSFVKANKPATEKKLRKKRSKGYARPLDKVTRRVFHACQQCPKCEVTLSGGRVQARRRIIELPAVKVEVVEHLVVERSCPLCKESFTPVVDFSQRVVGRRRVGISLQSEVAILRQQLRLPFRVIADYMKQRWGVKLSIGELVGLVQGVAERGKAEYKELGNKIRGSAVVNADETSWRESGQNGYLWGFSTQEVRYFLYRRSRGQAVVKEVLGEEFEGVLVTDFYGAYNVHKGAHQRCWTHLLRDIHELKEKHEKDESVQKWAEAVREIYDRAKAYKGPNPRMWPADQSAQRVKAQREFEQELMEVCKEHIKKKEPMSTLCERIERHLPELFMFVADPRVPADNNAAERSLREPVVSRKISGGTRSEKGSETRSILASLFGTWRLSGLDPYESCRKILTTQKSQV